MIMVAMGMAWCRIFGLELPESVGVSVPITVVVVIVMGFLLFIQPS